MQDIKRPAHLRVRVSSTERAVFEHAARARGFTLSEWVRWAAHQVAARDADVIVKSGESA